MRGSACRSRPSGPAALQDRPPSGPLRLQPTAPRLRQAACPEKAYERWAPASMPCAATPPCSCGRMSWRRRWGILHADPGRAWERRGQRRRSRELRRRAPGAPTPRRSWSRGHAGGLRKTVDEIAPGEIFVPSPARTSHRPGGWARWRGERVSPSHSLSDQGGRSRRRLRKLTTNGIGSSAPAQRPLSPMAKPGRLDGVIPTTTDGASGAAERRKTYRRCGIAQVQAGLPTTNHDAATVHDHLRRDLDQQASP